MESVSNTVIRTARETDLPVLTEVYNAAVTATDFTGHLAALTVDERHSWWQSHQDPRFPILVAEANGEILGYASLSVWYDLPVYIHTAESSLYLAANAQGRGLGTMLMQALLKEARRIGHHVVIARVWSRNLVSIAMCRKCGYEIVGTQREVGHRNGTWEDCVLMQVIV